MASSLLARALGVIEMLSQASEGLTAQAIAEGLPMSKAGAQRLLNELQSFGYLVQRPNDSRYLLTTRLAALSMRFLSEKGVVDVAEPHLERLAERCGELVRLAVVKEGTLTYVAKSQGSRAGLRYDPSPQEELVPLYCTATAYAWLAQQSDNDALALIAQQGLLEPETRGPNLPPTLDDIRPYLQRTRENGYAVVKDLSSPGMSAVATALFDKSRQHCIGALVIGAPTARLSDTEIAEYVPALLATAEALADISNLSEHLRGLLSPPRSTSVAI